MLVPSDYCEHQHHKSAVQKPAATGKRINDEALLAHIKVAHAASKGEYGWLRIWKEACANGVRVGKERIQSIMKLHGIKASGRKTCCHHRQQAQSADRAEIAQT